MHSNGTSNPNDAEQIKTALKDAASTAAFRLSADHGMSPAEVATTIRRVVDNAIEYILPRFDDDILSPTDRRVFEALKRLEQEAGVTFKTTRDALVAESDVRPISVGICLHRLQNDGYIEFEGKTGQGTFVSILRAA